MLVNSHHRVMSLKKEDAFILLEDMGTESDKIWPEPKIPFKRTPGQMEVSKTKESHGIIKASLIEYIQNERIVWQADLPFLKGSHGFYISTESDGKIKICHVLEAKLSWWFKPIWILKVRKIHDAIIEGVFDRMEEQIEKKRDHRNIESH